MIIYGALLIPILTAYILYRYFGKETVWWEMLIPMAVSLLFTFSMKAIIEVVQVSSKEYWGSFISRAEYYEDWNEWITQICTRTVDCGKDCTTTETYDCSYCLYHPAIWRIITTTNEVVYVSEGEYNRVKRILGNESFEDLGRNYYTDDGDEYYSNWSEDSITAIPVTTLHYYENRVKAADQSVFHFETVKEDDIKRFALKSYPDITGYYQMEGVLGDSSIDAIIANKKIKYINGLLGHKKEVKVFILIFKNQPIEAAFYQEWLWSGGNMNEFIVCIGIDNSRNITWCKPISWTYNEQLKTEVKSFVQNQKTLNISSIADHLQSEINKNFTRRNFEEFNYLTVEPPTWSVILTYLLTIGVNFGLSYWIIKNDF